MSRAEVDLQNAVKKACNADEVPPKRKHVRACIVYTWDHKNSRAFWNAVKIQPLQGEQVSLFKALITIHKVLQEGHPNLLKDGYRNKDFIASLQTVFPSNGTAYGRLIKQYDQYLLQKLDFHRNNPGFNGTFEYEEYISLRAVNDPNEGYESVMQLMDLQDSINDLQKLIFATIHQTLNNLCKVSALVPLIAELYGIYKFLTLMLRALYQQLGNDEALQILFERYDLQHFMLRDFYTDCQGIKFLTSLVTIPRLQNNPPNLQVTDNGDIPESARSVDREESQTPAMSSRAPTPPPVDSLALQQTGIFAVQPQLIEQQQELEAQRQAQLQAQLAQQRAFEEQQRAQEQLFLQQQHQLQQQQTQAHQLRFQELEHDLLMFKNQYDNDQLLLQQYDARMKQLETELLNLNNTASQQVASKDDQILNLEEQIAAWTKKYELLAKLYLQLRQEHLNLLAKFKKIQQKILSAQELVLKKEKLEKDLKGKNLELADLIRERDRARLELDRLRATKDSAIEKLETEIRELSLVAREHGRRELTLGRHEEELEKLKRDLQDRDLKIRELAPLLLLQDQLKEKDDDLEIMKELLDSALRELALVKNDQDDLVNAQIDQILLENIDKLIRLLDIFLSNTVKTVQDTRLELFLPLQAGNQNATPEYLLLLIEKCLDVATDFSLAFNEFIADGKRVYEDDGNYSAIIVFASSLGNISNDIMLAAKGLARNARADEDVLTKDVAGVLDSIESFFSSLFLEKLSQLEDEDDKVDRVIDGNLSVQQSLQKLSKYIDSLHAILGINWSGNVEDAVSHEMNQAEKAVANAQQFLLGLLKDPTISGARFEVHEAILAAAVALTDAIAILIRCATELQREIVLRGVQGSQLRSEFYKKNSRWTEGLVSALKAVAGATNILIQTADGVLKEKNLHEQLIVALNEVAALTAQLVAALRVKATFILKTQDNLEEALSVVTKACKSLVTKVQSLLQKEEEKNEIDLSKLTPYEGKTVEMEQQVEILKLENSLNAARKRLGEIRKYGYRDDNSDDES